MMWIQTMKGFWFALLALAIASGLLLKLEILEQDIPTALQQAISKALSPLSRSQKNSEEPHQEPDHSTSISDDIDFTLDLEWIWQGMPLTVHSAGSYGASPTEKTLTIHSCSGALQMFPFDLLEAITLSEQQGQWTATPLFLKIGEGELSLVYAEENIQGSLKLEHFPLTSLPFHFTDFPLNGSFSLDATLAGPLSSPKLNLSLLASDVTSANDTFAKLGATSVQLMLSLGDQLLAVQGRILPSNHFPIDFDVQLPAVFRLYHPLNSQFGKAIASQYGNVQSEGDIAPFVLDIAPHAPLSGNITAEWEMAQLLHSLLDTPTTFSGHAAASFQLSGTYSQPEVKGTGRLTNGSYEIPEIGVSLTNLSANIEANGTQLQIKDLQAVDGKEGSVTGTGYFLIEPVQHYPFTLQLDLKEAALLNQDYVQIVCNGPLTLTGNQEGGKLQGQLQASTASIAIPDRSYAARNLVDVTYINIPQHMPTPQSLHIRQSHSWPLGLDIHLQFPRSLSITGRDLTSTWRGEIDIQGTAKEPLIFGELKISDGEYLFNGNPFDISQGTITFAGDIDKKTALYVIAGKDLDKVKVDVIAKGAIKNPEISFRSNPPLPQREILSWILFNRGTSEISPFQGAQLSESITNLSANQQGPDVLSKIRSTLGIDRFEIGRNPNSNSNDVNIQIGKYISDNFLISVIKSDVSKVAIEATLTDTIKLQAQVGEDAQGQLLLKWKRDY